MSLLLILFVHYTAIDYIHEMEKEKDNHEQELDSLKKEIIALKIMKSYENLFSHILFFFDIL